MACDENLYRQYLSGDDEGLNALMKKIRRPPDPVYRRLSARRSRVRRADAGRFRLSVHEKTPHPGWRPQGVSV